MSARPIEETLLNQEIELPISISTISVYPQSFGEPFVDFARFRCVNPTASFNYEVEVAHVNLGRVDHTAKQPNFLNVERQLTAIVDGNATYQEVIEFFPSSLFGSPCASICDRAGHVPSP